MHDWKTYFEQTKDRPPRDMLVRALPFVNELGTALDLGAGALNDSKYLLGHGFKEVTALDIEAVAQEIAAKLPRDRFRYVIESFDSFVYEPQRYDFINAQYSLPFIAPERFDDIFKRIIASLKIGGIFSGQFFGNGDEWAHKDTMTFLTKSQVQSLLKQFEVLYFEEEKKEKPTAAGTLKRWHVFHCIFRKR